MVNRVILIGNLGQDPGVKHTASGTAVATLNLATTRRIKKNEQWEDETEWHRVQTWAKTAEFCGKYLSKGSKVYVEGRLQTRKWKDQQGADRYTTEVVADLVQNLSPRNDDTRQAPPEPFGGVGGGTGDSVPF